MVSCKINDVSVDIDKNPTYSRNLTEDLEYATIIITNDVIYRYEPLSRVELETPTIEQYIIESDNITELQEGQYEHNITLVENIAYFNKYIPASRSHQTRTGFAITLRNVLNKYKRELGRFHYVDIDFVEGSYLDVAISPREYDGQTVADIMLDLFRTVDAYAKVYYDNGTWMFYPQFMNARNNLIDNLRETYYSQQNNIDYATKIRTSVKNGVFSNPEPVWFPSPTGYIRPRAEGVVFRESRARYELDSNTAVVIEVIAPNIFIELQDESGNIIDSFTEDFDITSHVVTQEEYDSLRVITNTQAINYTQGKHRQNTVRLDISNNEIYGLAEEEGGFLGFTAFTNMLANAIKTKVYEKYSFSSVATVGGVTTVENTWLRVKYLRLRDNDLTVQRISNQGFNQSTMGYSQQSSTVDTGKYMSSLGLLANRMGNQQKSITKSFNYDDVLYEVGDYDSDGYVITEAKYTLYDNDIMGEFVMNKNYANVNADNALRYELTPYTVQAKKLITNVIDENYIVASEFSIPLNTKLSSRGINSLFGIFTGQNKERIEFGVYTHPRQTYDFDKAIHMPVDTQVGGNSMAFNVHFLKNLIAGKRYEEVSGSTYLQPILYTASEDDDFILEDFALYFSNNVEINDTGDYPLIDETTQVVTNALTINELMPIDLGINDALAYTFVIHGVTAQDDKVGIAQGFFRHNPLYKQGTTTLSLYKSTYPYGVADKKLRSSDTLVTGGGYSFLNASKKLTVYGSENFDYWALVVGDDIVVWGNNTKDVYFGLEKELRENYDPQTILTFGYTESTNLTLNYSFTKQDVTLIEEGFNFETNLELNYDVTIGDFTIITREAYFETNTSLNYALTIENKTLINEAFAFNTSLSLNHQLTIENVTIITQGFNFTVTPTVNHTYTINNIILAFDYQGTTTQPYDDTKQYFVGDGTTTTSCPSANTTINWFNSNYSPYDYNVGDVIRVITYQYDADFSNEYIECERYYFEVIEA